MTMVALGLGFGLTWFALTSEGAIGTFRFGPWVSWPGVGAPDPDPYTRARMARTGALPLGRSEGIEFVAAHDSTGRPLVSNCTYRLAGNTPVATFWTLYAATSDGSNLAPEGMAEALNSARLMREPDGSVVIAVGPALSPGNWLETTALPRRPVRLILTLYDAAVFSGLGSDVSSLPEIREVSCS